MKANRQKTSPKENRFERHPALAWLLIGAILVLIAEITLRLIEPEPVQFAKDFREIYRYHDRWFTDFEPDTTTTIRLSDGQTGYYLNFLVTINEFGFRWHDRLIDAPLPDARNAYIIHAIGDSFTMGWGVNYESSYPAQLERLLGYEYTVLNLGLNGYGTIGATEKSLHLLEEFPPRVAIYLVTENDYDDDAAAGRHIARPPIVHLGYDLLNVLRRNTYLMNIPYALRWWLHFRPGRHADSATRHAPQFGEITSLDIPARSDPEIGTDSKAALKNYIKILSSFDIPIIIVANGAGPVATDLASFSAEQGISSYLVQFDDSLLLRREGHLNAHGNRILAIYIHSIIRDLALLPD